MARDLGSPEMFKAAEKIAYERLAAAQGENGGDHYLIHRQVQREAANDPTLAEANIFLFLGTGLEVINRLEAKPN